MVILVAGPRTQKTTAYAVPALLATSNKRDLYDTTRTLRAQHGRLWLFDPQAVASPSNTATGPGWWWNPLT